MKKLSPFLLTLITLATFVTACQKKEASTSQSPKVVNLATWSNLVSPQVLEDFQKATGIKVEVSYFSSNEELLAKLQAGASGYDVIMPTDYMVATMEKLGLLQELDKSQLPEHKALDPAFLKQNFDPTNKFSLPYDRGTTGIAVNRKQYSGSITSWRDIFDNPKIASRFTLLDDVRETLGAALKFSGASLNSHKPEDLEKAKNVLIKARKNIKAFNSETLAPLASGEVAVAHAYVSDTLQANKRSGGQVEFVIPQEGCTIWMDTLAIPKAAPHNAEGHALINYLLSAKANVAMTLSIFASPSNAQATGLLPSDLKANKSLFPPSALLSKCEMIADLGEAITLWDRVWTEIKSSAE